MCSAALDISRLFLALDASSTFDMINSARAVSGFARVEAEEYITRALAHRRDELRALIIDALSAHGKVEYARAALKLSEAYDEDGQRGSALIEDVVADYALRVSDDMARVKMKLDSKINAINKIDSYMSSTSRRTVRAQYATETLERAVCALQELLREWNELAKPMLNISAAQGDLHAQSREVYDALVMISAEFSGTHYNIAQTVILMRAVLDAVKQFPLYVEKWETILKQIIELVEHSTNISWRDEYRDNVTDAQLKANCERERASVNGARYKVVLSTPRDIKFLYPGRCMRCFKSTYNILSYQDFGGDCNCDIRGKYIPVCNDCHSELVRETNIVKAQKAEYDKQRVKRAKIAVFINACISLGAGLTLLFIMNLFGVSVKAAFWHGISAAFALSAWFIYRPIKYFLPGFSLFNCNYPFDPLVSVEKSRYDNSRITFCFTNASYAREFAKLNNSKVSEVCPPPSEEDKRARSEKIKLKEAHLKAEKWMLMSFIAVFLITVRIAISIDASSGSNDARAPAQIARPTYTRRPAPTPTANTFINGYITTYPSYERVCPFTVINNTDMDFCMRLVYMGKPELGGGYREYERDTWYMEPLESDMAFIIRAGGAVDVKVPIGAYQQILYTGDTYYGAETLFGPTSKKYTSKDNISFYMDVSDYCGYEQRLFLTETNQLQSSIATQRLPREK